MTRSDWGWRARAPCAPHAATPLKCCYLLLEHCEPVDVTEPVMIFDIIDPIDEVAIATRQVLLYHVLQQVAQVVREELGHFVLHQPNNVTYIYTVIQKTTLM